MADYTNNLTSVSRVSVGRTYNVVDEINYLDITRRLVHLEQILSGKVSEYNGPVVMVGGVVNCYTGTTGVPTPEAYWKKCDGSTVNDKDSPINGQAVPTVSGTGYFGYIRIK